MGVIWGWSVGSQMILLDGIYAFIGVAVSWLLLQASAMAHEAPSTSFSSVERPPFRSSSVSRDR